MQSPALQASAEGSPPLWRNLTLWACSALHTVNDAFFAVIFPLLPLLAADLGLSYAEVGLIKTAFSASSAVFQVPVGMLAERWGEYTLLVGGNAWVAAGLIGMGLAASYPVLLAMTVLAGLGGNTQHPIAASLVSRRAPLERRATEVGTLNFAGDLGKMAGPPLVALVAIPFGWQAALISLGIFGLLFSAVVAFLPAGGSRSPRASAGPERADSSLRSADHQGSPGWGIEQPRRFSALTALGIIDGSTRGAALAFLPFVLASKGLDPVQVSWIFTVVFVGGAFGKFGCGRLGDQFGATTLILVTEMVTAASLLVFPWSPVLLIPLLALAFGFVLNGTSSVLYATVAELVREDRRARGYGLYYTLVSGTSALALVLYGILGDQTGLTALFVTMAAVNAITIPLARVLQRTR